MNDDGHRPIAVDKVVAVLLADGWHRVVSGTFTVGPLGLGDGAGDDRMGFRFEEDDGGSPYSPGTLAGPVDTLIAVRQLTSRGWRRWPDSARRHDSGSSDEGSIRVTG